MIERTIDVDGAIRTPGKRTRLIEERCKARLGTVVLPLLRSAVKTASDAAPDQRAPLIERAGNAVRALRETGVISKKDTATQEVRLSSRRRW